MDNRVIRTIIGILEGLPLKRGSSYFGEDSKFTRYLKNLISFSFSWWLLFQLESFKTLLKDFQV